MKMKIGRSFERCRESSSSQEWMRTSPEVLLSHLEEKEWEQKKKRSIFLLLQSSRGASAAHPPEVPRVVLSSWEARAGAPGPSIPQGMQTHSCPPKLVAEKGRCQPSPVPVPRAKLPAGMQGWAPCPQSTTEHAAVTFTCTLVNSRAINTNLLNPKVVCFLTLTLPCFPLVAGFKSRSAGSQMRLARPPARIAVAVSASPLGLKCSHLTAFILPAPASSRCRAEPEHLSACKHSRHWFAACGKRCCSVSSAASLAVLCEPHWQTPAAARNPQQWELSFSVTTYSHALSIREH